MMGSLFVISGPSGVGKGTLCKLAQKMLENIWISISMTSREIREEEIENISYYYTSAEEFTKKIKSGEFLEYIEVYKGYYYGTLLKPVTDHLTSGYNVILEIDVDGADRVKEYTDDVIRIFILPPSVEELERRLVKRDQDTNKNYNERIERAKNYEIPKSIEFDYCIVNDDLDIAAKELCDIIKAHTNKE